MTSGSATPIALPASDPNAAELRATFFTHHAETA